MKKLLLFILLLLPFCLKAQQTHPVAPQQMNQNTSYNEPSTGDWWIYRGATYGWFHVNKSLPVPNTVLTGLGMSVSNDTLTVATGTWRIGNAVFSLSSPVQFVLSARDSIYSRYETVYADSVNNGIHIAVGALSPTPVEPSIPTGDLRVGAVLITPTGTSILPPTPTTDYVFSQPTVLQSYANPWVRTIRADTGKFSGYILPTHDGLSGQSPQTDGAGNLFFATPNVNGVGYGLLLNANNAILDTTKVITPWKLDSTLLANTAIFNPDQFSISHDTVNLISYLTSDTSTNNTTNYFSTKAVKQLIANGAGGGITSIGVTTANGISGTSSGGTTPSLTLALGNIAPTSISTIVKPATVFQTGVGSSSDSLVVKHLGGLGAINGSSVYSLLSNLTSDTTTNNTTKYFSTQAVKQLIAAGGGSGGTTIYSGDGTLASNRLISNGGKSLAVSDSLYVNVPSTYSTPSGSITFLGTSITYGVGVTGSGVRYSTQVANALSLTENNLGISGAHIQVTGDGYSFQDHESSVPVYSAGSTIWLVIEVGPNDFNNYTGGAGTFQPTTYQTDLTNLLTYLTGTKGWPVNRILILNNPYVAVVYPTSVYTATKTATVYNSYKAATLAVANSFGTLYYDFYSVLSHSGGDFNIYDNLHPNNQGHTYDADGVLSILKPGTVYKKAQNLAAGGQSELQNLKINNNAILYDGSVLLGKDSLNNVGVIGSLPNNIRFAGNGYLTGQWLNVGIPVASGITLGSQDWLIGQQKIYSVNSNGVNYTTFQPSDPNVGFTFKTNLNLGTNAIASFYSGAGSLTTSILQNGTIKTENIVFNSYGDGLTMLGGGVSSGFYPFDSNFGTNIKNLYKNGPGIGFYTAPVTAGTAVLQGYITEVGNWILGPTSTSTDDGFKFDVTTGNSRFDNNVSFGKIASIALPGNPTTSTSGGTLTAATYYYTVTALDRFGNETNWSSEGHVATTGSTSSNTITWTGNSNAASYRIYQGTSAGAESKYITAAAGATSVVDIGSGYTTLSPSTQNKTYYSTFTNGAYNSGVVQTTVNGSTSGTATFSQPMQGPVYKLVVIHLNALVGTATYTFPAAFINTPSVIGTDDVATTVVTSKSTTSVTVTGATSTGTLTLIGY